MRARTRGRAHARDGLNKKKGVSEGVPPPPPDSPEKSSRAVIWFSDIASLLKAKSPMVVLKNHCVTALAISEASRPLAALIVLGDERRVFSRVLRRALPGPTVESSSAPTSGQPRERIRLIALLLTFGSFPLEF